MATGEYISVANQNEQPIDSLPEEEKAEPQEVFVEYGANLVSAARVVEAIFRDPEVRRAHVSEKLGVDLSSLPSPPVPAIASLLSCAVGGMIPLLPFLLGSTSRVPGVGHWPH